MGKRHSTGVLQQMQSQLTDLREKLTSAFGEITSLVKQKTQSDRELMTDMNALQDNLQSKTSELEALKRSYSQAHNQLQSSLMQIQSHLQVTNGEVQAAKASCERVQRETAGSFADIDENVRSIENELTVGNAENRNQMLQLQKEIARIHESLSSVNAEFLDHKRATNSVNNKLQSQLAGVEVGRMLPSDVGSGPRATSYAPEPVQAVPMKTPISADSSPTGAAANIMVQQPAGASSIMGQPVRLTGGSATYPHAMAPPTISSAIALPPPIPTGGPTILSA